MKKLTYLVAILAIFASSSFGATLLPIQLLNPAGSTNGQAIVSTGASSAPGWTSVAATSGTTFTGLTGVSYPSATFFVNDSTGAGSALIQLRNTTVNEWVLYNSSTASNQFALGRYVAGSFVDNPIAVSNSTGVVTMGDGIANTPISGSTGSFTTVTASSTITPSQTAGIVGTTTNNSANAGSVGEILTATGTAVSLSSGTPANCTSKALTAGQWSITGSIIFNANTGTTTSLTQAGFNTTTGTLPASPFTAQDASSVPASFGSGYAIPPQTVQLAAGATYFLVANATFAVSTMTATCVITAVRQR